MNIEKTNSKELYPLIKNLNLYQTIINKKHNYIRKKINFKKLYKYLYFFINKYYSIFLFMIAYYLYYLSLDKCLEGIIECCKKEFWIKKLIFEEVLSCLILSLLLNLIFYKIITKLHLIHIAITCFYFYKYSHGRDFDDHGYFNIFGFISLFIIILLFLFPFNIIIYLKKKIKYLFFFIFIFIINLFLFYSLTKFGFLNCDDWPKGLNNTYINNDKSIYDCQIMIPKICPYKFGKYFLDLTKIKRINCLKQKNSKEIILANSNSPYLNKTFKRIGYPLTNKDSFHFSESIYTKKYFLQNLVNMDNKEILNSVFRNKTPEIEVDFNNNYNGDMIINLHYNKTLSEERKKKEINTQPYSNNYK